jgi:GNAT superfamily N-acetyltransferase
MDEKGSMEIVHPPRERWGSVLNLALSHRPFAERVRLTDALLKPAPGERPGAGFDGLLEARQAGQTVGAALAVLQPGRTALIYQPRLVDGAPAAARNQLNAGLDAYLRKNQVQLAQEVLDLEASDDAAAAHAAGYDIPVELVYLAVDSAPSGQPAPASDWSFQPYRDTEQPRLESLLIHSYDATLDCPEINGVRSAADTIHGYQAAGDFVPDGWRLIHSPSADVGCLLVNRHDESMAELVYMGLVAEARGRGRSKELIAWAKWLARELRCATLSVAVDARNTPAHRAYLRAGFVEFDRRLILLRTFR